MTIMVMDGQGGRMGKSVVEQIRKRFPEDEILAIGTNSIATAAMLKAGADAGATGENPAIVGSRRADIIIGPMGIVIADSLMGEITPDMAVALGQSQAKKVLIPVNRCQHFVVGCQDLPLGDYVKLVVEQVEAIKRGGALSLRLPLVIDPFPFLCPLHLCHLALVHPQEFYQLITVDPDLVVPFLLGLVEDQLEAEMEMGRVDVVGVFRGAVSGSAQIADHISGSDHAAF